MLTGSTSNVKAAKFLTTIKKREQNYALIQKLENISCDSIA